MKRLLLIFPVMLLFLLIPSCSNQDIEFDDFEFQSVYFAYQYPVRTITLGEDFVDTSMDNEFKFQIMATLGGVYSNKKDVRIDIAVDNSLVDGFQYSGGQELKAMPDNYYQMAGNSIVIPKGRIVGGVQVQLSEAFFADPLALHTNYVIPVRMLSVENADTILSGLPAPLIQNPRRLAEDDWEIQPKDFVLYAVKYVNPWHGYYLRRGVDQITGKDGHSELDKVNIRRATNVEYDQVMLLSSSSFVSVDMPVILQDAGGNNIDTPIRLTFDQNGQCVITSPSNEYSASGSGAFIKLGEKNSWGSKDRDAIYLTYEIDHDIMQVATTDTLVLRNRGVGMETFSVIPIEE